MLPFIFLVIGVLTQQTFAEEPEAIVGGQPAALGEFPHQVSLRLNGNHICGGSIIGNTKILTAAHCVDGTARPPYNNFTIATGTISISGGQIHNVARVVVHPQYSGSQKDAYNNDVAVITLLAPIQYNQYQRPIFLADSEPAPWQLCTLSGWGQTRFLEPLPKNLLKIIQVVIPTRQCQEFFHDMPLSGPGSNLCALHKQGIGACLGDSGSPLISNGVQIGISSWVILTCAQGVPDGYINVAYHRNWILSQ